MKWDMHCDVLSKLLMDDRISFHDSSVLDVTYDRLQAGGIGLQAFAIYIPEAWKGKPYDAVLRSIDLFRRKVLSHPGMTMIQTKEDLAKIGQPGNEKIGALLTLEGADGLEGDLMYLRIAYDLGVRTVGVTWNPANWAADGIGEARSGGFTAKGWKFVEECERIGLTLDVSHLSERGFWELAERGKRPFIASHSNMKSLCNHQRNITDEQVRAILNTDGRIGITFVPFFLRDDGKQATIDDVLRHVERVCELGGEKHVGFGSDFDGISEWVYGLEHPGLYRNIENELLKRYSTMQVNGFMGTNWKQFYKNALPYAP